MAYYTEAIKLSTKSSRFYNITHKVLEVIKRSEVKNGICHVFCPGSTGAILLNEHEPMLEKDFRNSLDQLVPHDFKLHHHPDNAFSHIRAMLIGASESFPIESGDAMLGQWQNVIFCECDSKDRDRHIIVTIVGDSE